VRVPECVRVFVYLYVCVDVSVCVHVFTCECVHPAAELVRIVIIQAHRHNLQAQAGILRLARYDNRVRAV
jgi:hypothetical protein